MKINKLRSIDVFIILFLILAAPIGYTLKILDKKNSQQKSSQYSIQISIKDKIENLNHYNLNEHYKIIKNAVEKKENYGYFISCIVFNRYKDDLMISNKTFYNTEELYHENLQKLDLFNWCLKSYNYIKDDTPSNMLSAYYYTLGLANLYGFKTNIDLSKSLLFTERAYDINKDAEYNRLIQSIKKNKNIYPAFKDIYLVPYIDNEIKNNKIK